MTFAERVYSILLHLYPASFRREYGEPMRQAFRDQLRDVMGRPQMRHFWLRTIDDLLRSAATLRLEESMRKSLSITPLVALAFGLAAAVFLGRFELHTDDSGVEVFFVLLFTFILGCWYPQGAWLEWLLGLSIPLAELIWGQPRASLNFTTGLAKLAAFVAVLGLVGSYTGVFVRRFVIPSR